MDQKELITQRSDEMRDILKKMPHWTIQWGITLILAVVSLLLVFSYLYRYPDLIRCEVVISATHPPVEMKARSSGKITGIFVGNGETTLPGQILALIENSAGLSDVQQLEHYLVGMEDFMNGFRPEKVPEPPVDPKLGDIQPTYADLSKLVSDYLFFISQDYYRERIEALDGQMQMQQQFLERLDEQKEIEEQRRHLAENSFRRDSLLFEKRTIPEHDFEKSKESWLAAKIAYESILSERFSVRSGLFKLQQEKAALRLDYDNQLKVYKTEIVKAYTLVQSAIQNWYLLYVLRSPIEGSVSFSRVWAKNQNVTQGETVMTLVPEAPLHVIGKARVPVTGAGKVKNGQRVNIKLANYPYMEYGMLVGRVKHMAPVPLEMYYFIEIELPDDLTTNYGTKLDMHQELRGTAEIITHDRRLIERLIDPIKNLVEKNRR
ncbi:MAG TPA: HlyD family efflux transporter periplasmic adaptor subunit [Prolixibacteraceae bacterium]|nr:HlyD family efflux transporter periplasmic adaptor subunit [Prolixibacteraceae bacterium]